MYAAQRRNDRAGRSGSECGKTRGQNLGELNKLEHDTKMPAYVIAEIEITDPVAYEEYRRRVNEVNAKFGGRFIVRGGRIESVEGDWSPKRLAIVEFPSMEQALKWYRSDDLAPLIALRQRAARSKFIIVEGI